MAGGIVQLVAYGAQDIYLTGNPQITFFKVIFRRHTHFSMEPIQQQFSSDPDFGKKISITLNKNGDLIHNVYFHTFLPSVNASGFMFGWVREVGNFLLKKMELDIGGSIIDTQYGTWLSVWVSLTLPLGKLDGYDIMIGNVGEILTTNTTNKPRYELTVPLQFWFCNNYGLALPLIALQYTDIKINIELETLDNLINPNSVFFPDAATTHLDDTYLVTEYVYLDTAERRKFSENSHEYLITQVQLTEQDLEGTQYIVDDNPNRLNIPMYFTNPVQELIWVFKIDDTAPPNYTDLPDFAGINPLVSAVIEINNDNRFKEREGVYFNYVQPYQFHTNTPKVGINSYSFSLYPEKHQPSGSLNFLRLDSADLIVSLTNDYIAQTGKKILLFATNYNILRFVSGIASLSYSNS